MTSKSFYYCKHCDKLLGWKFGGLPFDEVYCFACEPVVTHKEEMRQAELIRYRALARS